MHKSHIYLVKHNFSYTNIVPEYTTYKYTYITHIISNYEDYFLYGILKFLRDVGMQTNYTNFYH